MALRYKIVEMGCYRIHLTSARQDLVIEVNPRPDRTCGYKVEALREGRRTYSCYLGGALRFGLLERECEEARCSRRTTQQVVQWARSIEPYWAGAEDILD